MYTKSKDMIYAAKKGGYAVPAFNAENLEMVQAIIAAAEETGSPVMIQTTPSTVKYLSLHEAVAMVSAQAKIASVPVALHLDHCESYEGVVAALDARGQSGTSEDTGGVTGTTYHGGIIRGLDDGPENILMRHIFLDTAQLAGLVMTMPEVDETRVGAYGGSQGGGLT